MEKANSLVIDDEPGIFNVVTAYLRSEGFDFRTASDGVDGFNLIHSYQPDLIHPGRHGARHNGMEILSQPRRVSNATS